MKAHSHQSVAVRRETTHRFVEHRFGLPRTDLAESFVGRRIASSRNKWPFDNPDTVSRPLHLVEVFPSYYFALAGIKPVNGAHGERENINQALACFGSDSVGSLKGQLQLISPICRSSSVSP